MKKINSTKFIRLYNTKLIFLVLFIIGTVFIKNYPFTISESSKGITIVETEYKATSPNGENGGIALPASCESGAWNNNSGYHLAAPYTDPGNCATPIYNCEAGVTNPALGIIPNHTLLGVALNAATRWYTNIWGGSGVGGCFYNSSGVNYFVPTGTQIERNSFLNNLPAGVSKANGGW